MKNGRMYVGPTKRRQPAVLIEGFLLPMALMKSCWISLLLLCFERSAVGCFGVVLQEEEGTRYLLEERVGGRVDDCPVISCQEHIIFVLHLWMQEYSFPNRILMQDNAPPHRARSTIQ
jgi:hypothetical protein